VHPQPSRTPRRIAGVAAGLLLALLAGLLPAPAARAEGSRDLTAQGGHRAYLEWRPASLLGGIPRRTVVKVYAEAGETIDLGSSAAGLGAGTIDIRSPDGASGSCGSAGLIGNRTEEANGPEPVVGTGYIPCTVAVAAGQTGVWEIDFVSPTPASTTNPPALPAGDPWAQPDTVSYVSAWDVTVRSTGGARIPGRVFANYLSLNMGANNIAFEPSLFVQTRDGYRYRIGPNGLDPFVFIFFANNQGFRDAAGNLLYRSVQLSTSDAFQNGENVHSPAAADTQSEVTHKIFFAQPDSALPASAPSPSGETWLQMAPAEPPTASGFTFTGSEGTPGQAGQGAGGTFSFDSSGTGNHSITLDLNRDGVFGNGNDRILAGITSEGPNEVVWDGTDGDGDAVPASASGFQVRLNLHSAEVHFPLLDAENNPNGLIVERQVPSPSSYTVYYDDRGLSGGTPPSPLEARTGVTSETGAQAFSGGFGDHKGIDTWTYRSSSPELLASAIQVAQADLSVTKTDGRTTVSEGEEIVYQIEVANLGPSGVTGADLADSVPADVTGVSWTCQITSGIGSCGQAAGGGNAVATSLDLDANAVATITVTGTLGPGAPRTLSNTATVTRPDDVDDPDATNDSATDSTTVERAPAVTIAGPADVDESAGAERTYTFSVTDPDPGATFTVTGSPSCGSGGAYVAGSVTVEPSGGSFRCVFADGPVSPTVAIAVADEGGLAGDGAHPVAVANVAPAIASVTDTGPVDEGSAAAVTVSAGDPAGAADALTYEFDCDGDGDYSGAADVGPQAGPSASCSFGAEGAQVVNVRVRDGDGGSTTSSATVTVRNVAPAPAADAYDTDEDTTLPVDAPGVLGNDSDRPDDPLSAEVVGAPGHGILTLGPDGSVLYTPLPDYHGPDTFTYRACDDEGACSAPETVTITVRPSDDAPDALDDVSATAEDTPVTVEVLGNDSDVEGSPLTVVDFAQPSGGRVDCTPAGACTYAPAPDFAGDDAFVYTVSDGGGEATATVRVTVAAVNDAPAGQPDAYLVRAGEELRMGAPGVLANDSDADGDPLAVELVGDSAHGALAAEPDGSFTYRPEAGFTGSDGFTYRACDDADSVRCSEVQTVTIAVVAADDPPRVDPPAPQPAPGTAQDTLVPAQDAPEAETEHEAFEGGEGRDESGTDPDSTEGGAPIDTAAGDTARARSQGDSSEGGSLPYTGLALGGLAALGLALLGTGLAGRRGLRARN